MSDGVPTESARPKTERLNFPKPAESPKQPVRQEERSAGQVITDTLNKGGSPDDTIKNLASGNFSLPEGAIIGSRTRPDGSLDLSRAAAAGSGGVAAAREVRESVEKENEEIRGRQVKEAKDMQPGTTEAVAQRLQTAINHYRKLLEQPETQYGNPSGKQRILDQLRSERKTLDRVIDKKADELIDKDVVKRADKSREYARKHGLEEDAEFWNNQPGSLQRSYREAEKMPASEAADRIDVLVNGWEKTIPNITDTKEVARLDFDIQCARSLQQKLYDEAPRATQDTQQKIVQTTPKQEAQSPQEQLEQRARQLAEITRRKGIGQIYGFVHPIDKNIPQGFAPGPGFDKGEDIQTEIMQGRYNEQCRILQRTIASHFPPSEVRNPYDNSNRQTWMMEQYGPDNTMQKITYDMYTETPFDTRPGVSVMLNVVVPTEIANQINTAVRENPDFADAYFKAIFPGVVGEDGSTHIRRKQATELLILDQRENPFNIQGEVLKLPHPIKY